MRRGRWLLGAVGLLFALAALSFCAGSRGRGAAAGVPTASDGVFGYLVVRSFIGATGGIVLDDGKAYAFDAQVGVRIYGVPEARRAKIAGIVDDADFFDLPARLENTDITDGNDVDIVVATSQRVHWSSNYMDRNEDHAAVSRAIGAEATPPARGIRVDSTPAMYAELEAYAARQHGSPKGAAVERWLGRARQMIEQHRSAGTQAATP